MDLQQIIDLSRQYGANPELILAEGGNISYKDNEYLYMKASDEKTGEKNEKSFVKMSREKLMSVLNKNYSDDPMMMEKELLENIMKATEKEYHNKCPGIEAVMHNIFPQKFVLYVHPSVICGITCAKKGKKTIMKLFSEGVAWIDVVKTGLQLILSAQKTMKDYKKSYSKPIDILFIENNGIFFAADSQAKIYRLVETAIQKIEKILTRKPDFTSADFNAEKATQIAPAIRMLTMNGHTAVVTFRVNKEIEKLVKSKEAFSKLSLSYTSDQIICLNEPLFISSYKTIEGQYKAIEESIGDYTERNNCYPKIIAVQELGIYVCGKDRKEADTAAKMFLDAVKISVFAESFGGGRFICAEDIDYIRGWEAEVYRRKAGFGVQRDGRAACKVAIVTGGAQGFGKGIAERMAAEGAYVVIADLNEKRASEVAEGLCEKYGVGASMAVKTDVADEESTRAMINGTVLEYGGLDVYINNAGINKPGGLEEMDAKTFEIINRVNYTAYFLGAKYASRIMKLQHRFNPGYFMDIIQINSKSGISGSNKNFAYAGSKFAGIGLTQSFALELAGSNIKVNSICPGNFFEGPLWSDPEKGMFIQYLKSGKVPGAKTVEDVKRFYETKVPLRRGCAPEDVAAAVLYLIEQKYETGQALPVTGGQLMLK